MRASGLALIVGTIAIAAPASAAPMTVKSAQAELLKLAAPNYERVDNNIGTGNFITQQITFPTACSMTMIRRWSAHRYGGQNFSAGTSVIDTYHFEQGYSISPTAPNSVLIAATSRNGRSVKAFLAKSPADAQRAKQVFEWLGANCEYLGDRTGHVPVGSVMACSPRGVPGLTIFDSGERAFVYSIHPSTGLYSGRLTVAFFKNDDGRRTNFGAYTVVPQFMVPTADAPKNVARYIFHADGRELMFGLRITPSGDQSITLPDSWSDQLPLYRALAKGKKLTVHAFDSRPSRVGEWTFDLSGLRTLDGILRSTVRRC